MQINYKGDNADSLMSSNNNRYHERSGMKSKVLMVAAVSLIVSLVCLGTVSCRHASTTIPGDIEEPNGSDDVMQPLSEDEYRIEIAAIAVELIAIVNGLDQVLVNPEIEDSDWITTITLAMEDVTTLCNEACQIAPPDSMADVHVINLETIEGVDNAMGMLAEGIDEKDIDLVNQAITEMWLAAEILAEVIEVSK